MFPWQLSLFQSPPTLFQYVGDFQLEKHWSLKTLVNIFISCLQGTINKYQNGMTKVGRKAFNIGEVWNSVCCHGNKTVELILWSKFSRILLQRIKHFWYKLVRDIFPHYIWSKFHWVYEVINWLLIISLEQKETFEDSNQHFLLIWTAFLCFKMA